MANRKDNRWAQLPVADAGQRLVRVLFEAVFQRLDALDTNGTGSVPADGSVTAAKIASAAVTATKIAAGAVGLSKLAAEVLSYFPGAPDFTVGTEAANVINVAAQLKDYNGSNVATARVCQVWLSDTAGGALAAAAPDGGVAVGTNGTIVATLSAGKHWLVATTAGGAFDLNLTESTAKTLFLNVSHQGRLYSSAAITFA